jgi:hypothetical protein
MEELEAKLKAAQEEIMMLRRKKVVMPSRAAQLLGEIRRMAQRGGGHQRLAYFYIENI